MAPTPHLFLSITLAATIIPRWRYVDYAWWGINCVEMGVRMLVQRTKFWWCAPKPGGRNDCLSRLHYRNSLSVAVVAVAAIFSVGVGRDGYFFIIGSLRLPIVLT